MLNFPLNADSNRKYWRKTCKSIFRKQFAKRDPMTDPIILNNQLNLQKILNSHGVTGQSHSESADPVKLTNSLLYNRL